MKIRVFFEASNAIRDFGNAPDMETDTHPRDQLASTNCVVAHYPDGREVTIPAQSIAIIVTSEAAKK